MAVRKGTITYVDGTKEKVVLTTGDSIRANREAANKAKDSIISEDASEVLLYRGYLAAKKANLRGADKSFLNWADDVADFDIDLTNEMIETMIAAGEIDEDKAERLRKLVDTDDVPDSPGETKATPA